jgi:hypothetical protein
MNRLAKSFRVLGVARLLVAAILLFGIFASVVPLETVLAGPACRLACCAKRAPHSAGSCADGSCHASLKRKRREARHHSTSNPIKELCGLGRKSEIENKTRPRMNLASTKTETDAAAAFQTSCPVECSGTLANSSFQRNSAAMSVSTNPGQEPLHRTRVSLTDAQPSEVSCRDCAPRGPPLPLS